MFLSFFEKELPVKSGEYNASPELGLAGFKFR
jgi:hypothetical protein